MQEQSLTGIYRNSPLMRELRNPARQTRRSVATIPWADTLRSVMRMVAVCWHLWYKTVWVMEFAIE